MAVMVRNAFYRQGFYRMLGLCVTVFLVDLMLVGLFCHIRHHPVMPVYFPADTAGNLIQEVPLDAPVMPVEAVGAWAARAVTAAYSFDFVNYHAQLQNAQAWFSLPGWEEFMRGLERSNNLGAFAQRKLIGIAKVTAAPRLLKVGLMGDGRLAWKFEMPVLMEYRMPPFDARSVYYNPLKVTVVIRREDVLQARQGLGIVQMNAASAVSV